MWHRRRSGSIGEGPPAPDSHVNESAGQEVVVAGPAADRRRLLGTESASLHLRRSESGLAQLVELGKTCAGFDDVDLGVRADILQAEFLNLAEQGSAL